MTTKSKTLVFPEFDDIKVSTKTFIVMTNMTINIKNLFEFLPITDYIVVPKKRGRKKKIGNVNPNINIKSGSIITMKYENNLKGVDLKQKKNQKKKDVKWFRNSSTIVIFIDDKPVNLKICQNGVFQVTGCKTIYQVEQSLKYIWNYIKDQKDIYVFSRESNLEILIIPAMRNIDFSLGFTVDREKLTNYISRQTEFHSLLETSFGYTGVNIKLPLDKDIKLLEIKKIIYKNDEWIENLTTYSEYLEKLSLKEKSKKLNKERYNTFLVFHSGKTIMSGVNAHNMRDSYYYFLDIIRKSYSEIEEKLDK